jgi:hypothetical protein
MPRKTQTRKIRNLKSVIQKLQNALKDNWGVSKTQKHKRNQVGKMILEQKERELEELKKLHKLDFTNESAVRFFSRANNNALENTKEATAKEMKEKTGRYVSAKARTRKVIQSDEEMKKYIDTIRRKGEKTREILEKRWKAENNAEEARIKFERYMAKMKKQMEEAMAKK